MSPIISPSHLLTSLVLTGLAAIAFCFAGLAPAAADSAPDTENGRYALSQTADGLVRLDTRTGVVSTCSNTGKGWACYAVPDERKAMDDEIGRLQAENERLKAQLASRQSGSGGKTDQALPDKPATPKAGSERKIEIPLPSDADVDRVMSFIERAWRRLVDIANRMQKDASGKI
jgi:hypothetical protein